MKPECQACEHYIRPEAMASRGLCELVMDATGSGCSRVHEATLRRKGCPAGKFTAQVQAARPVTRSGDKVPYTLRKAGLA